MMRIERMALLCAALALPGVTEPPTLQAQDTGVRVAVPHKQILSANPFLFLGEWVNLEFERTVHRKSSLAGQMGYFTPDDASYVNFALIWRFYPQESALNGFYVGPRVAYYQVTEHGEDQGGDARGFGVELGYTWLFGEKRNFSVAAGFALTRLYGAEISGAALLPSFRLVNVGIAF